MEATKQEHLQILQGFAEFWKIPYKQGASTRLNQPRVCSGQLPESQARARYPTVVTPASLEDARKISEKFGLGLAVERSVVVLPYSPWVETAIEAVLFNFKGNRLETVIESRGNPVLSRIRDTQMYLLAIDLVSEFSLQIERGLEDPPSMRFRLATKLPLSYKAIPRSIRERAFRSDDKVGISGQKLGPIECLRTIFLASITTVSDSPIPRLGFWRKGKKFALAVTHDVETERGLVQGSPQLLKVEQDLGIRSTWNIVTNRYPLRGEGLHTLADSGDIGGHDTDHDGRLIFLPTRERVKRLQRCREALEQVTGRNVKGFRAPLLQHDRALVAAVGEAGFQFDSSVPSWEIRSPTSLKPHGVGTVFPFKVDGVLELPVSLPQDHQLLYVRGLTLNESVNALIGASKWVSGVGGLCTLLVHPDYDFALDDQGTEYFRLLKKFHDDSECEIITMEQGARWWSLRSKAHLEVSNGDVELVSSDSLEGSPEFETLSVTSYGPRGFSVEHLN